jgi:hypothetical protein
MRFTPEEKEKIRFLESMTGIRFSGRKHSAEELLARLEDVFPPEPLPKHIWCDAWSEAADCIKALRRRPREAADRNALLLSGSIDCFVRMTREGLAYYLPAFVRVLIEGERSTDEGLWGDFHTTLTMSLESILRDAHPIIEKAALIFTRRQLQALSDAYEFVMLRDG